MGRPADDDKNTDRHVSPRQAILLFTITVYSLGIMGQYFLLDTENLENSIRLLRDTIQKIEAKNKESLKRLDSLKHLDSTIADKEKKALKNIFNRMELVFKELERFTSGVGRRLSKRIVEAEMARRLSTSLTRMSYEQERNRRKVETLVGELWWFVEAYQFLDKQAGKSSDVRLPTAQKLTKSDVVNHSAVTVFKNKVQGYKRSISHALDKLRSSDSLDDDRLAMSLELGELVQRRLLAIQNPPNCSTARYLFCPSKACGFGCIIHHQVHCLIVAYATSRVMVVSKTGELAGKENERHPFKTLSEACPNENITENDQYFPLGDDDSERVLRHSIIEQVTEKTKKFLPLAIPADLAPKLTLFHGNPSAWWVGQLTAYIMRPTPEYQQELNELRERLGLDGLYVGIHVRRTDKIIEAAYHDLKEYMRHVEEYFENLETPVNKRKVFLASDDNLIDEARSSYPTFSFIHNPNVSMDRSSMSGLKGLVTDIFFLANSQFLVCTFSSQVCRLAYEMMQTMHGDASSWFRSLDDIYYFGGQTHHLVRVVEPSEEDVDADGNRVMKLRRGDLIEIAGNHWNGYSKGTLQSTGETALYPSYKTEDVLEYVCLPDYPNISSHFHFSFV